MTEEEKREFEEFLQWKEAKKKYEEEKKREQEEAERQKELAEQQREAERRAKERVKERAKAVNISDSWRKRSIPTHSGWLYPLTFDAGKGLKEA